MENKPRFLYRGLKINYNDLQDYQFTGKDLIVNYEPIIDKYGNKTVIDGNEYGVYMSDNLSMVEGVYGDLHNDGIALNKNLSIGGRRVLIPSVGVIYEIDTNGLDIKKPFITGYLKGHYNNGYQGDEWITDRVPAENYRLYRVRIGEDVLHDAEDIDLSRDSNIEEIVKKKVVERKIKLEELANAMARIPAFKRENFSREDIEILRLLFGKNGLKYINAECLITDTALGMLNYLISKSFKDKEPDIDFRFLKYLNKMRNQVDDVESIVILLKRDKLRLLEERKAALERKSNDGSVFSTSYFDIQIEKIDKALERINNRMMIDRHEEEINAMMEENQVSVDEGVKYYG